MFFQNYCFPLLRGANSKTKRICKGPHTINAAKVGSTRDPIIQKNVKTVYGLLCNSCALALGLALRIFATCTKLMSPKKGKTAAHCCDLVSLVLVMFGDSKRLSRSISLAVYCLLKQRTISCKRLFHGS